MIRKLYFRISLLLFAATCSGNLSAQQYDGSGMRIGYSYGRYTYQMSGPEIYCARWNSIASDTSANVIEVKEQFGSFRDFSGLAIGYQMESGENGKITVDLMWSMRRKTSSFEYVYDAGQGPVNYKEKVRLSTNMLCMTIGYRPTAGRLMFGVGMDLGFLRAKMKFTDASGSMTKWVPWFFTIGVLSEDPKAFTPIAGYSFCVAYDFSVFTIRLSHTRPVLDGSMLSQTGKYTNLPWSEKKFPITNTMVSLYFHLKG